MDITIRIKDGKSMTFIGDKKQILPKVQDFIDQNRHLPLTVHQDGKEEVTYKELFEERK
tara:strand:- start:504 stop:680 length:177 start_codon:yes stop_codon:yes gene_type:complete